MRLLLIISRAITTGFLSGDGVFALRAVAAISWCYFCADCLGYGYCHYLGCGCRGCQCSVSRSCLCVLFLCYASCLGLRLNLPLSIC